MRLLPSVVASAILLHAPATEGFVPAVRPLVMRPASTSATLRPLRTAALPQGAPVRHQSTIVASAVAAAPRRSLAASVARAAAWCLASIVTLLLTSARLAFAATTRRAASPGIGISGDVLKYVFVGGCVAAGYFLQSGDEPPPRFVYTEGAAQLDPETLKPIEDVSAAPKPTAAAELPPLPDEPLVLDDTALFGSLQARMQSLADENSKPADEEVPPPPVADSSDGWGTGDTAVLERPGADGEDVAPPPSSVFGDSTVEFPPGFPIVDGEVVEVDNTPAADADQVAMLNRMFGGGDAPTDESE